jgi:hypothetical protein
LTVPDTTTSRPRHIRDTGTDVDRDSADVAFAKLALARVETRADLDPQWVHALADRLAQLTRRSWRLE